VPARPTLSPKENLLEAIRFGRPEWVPLGCEPLLHVFQLEGLNRFEDWTDHWGVGWEVGIPGTVPFPKRHPLADLERLDDYSFPDPDELVLTDEMAHGLAAVDRSQRLVIGQLMRLLFERAWALMGMDNFLASLIERPADARRLLHGIADYGRRVFARYLDLGVDGVMISDDLGTQRAPMLSPQMARDFLLPEYEYCFADVLAAGKIVHFHTCGCIHDIAADLAGLGITVLDPIQARANDLAAVKSATFGRTALWGGIDTAVLALGGPEQVRAEVLRVMEILKPRGGWVCAPDQCIPGVPEENMQALWDTARAAGRY